MDLLHTTQPKTFSADLYKSSHGHFQGFIGNGVWNGGDVEEVLQLTYLEAVRSKDKFQGNSKPETSLLDTLTNLVKNCFKRCYKQAHTEDTTEALISKLQADIEADPSLVLEYECALEKTVDAMNKLPRKTQSIIDMVVND